MIVLGAILLILGFVLKVQILWTIGIILLVIGAVLWLLAPLAVLSAAGVTGIDRRVDDCRRVTERQSSSRATHQVNAPGRPIWPPGLHAVWCRIEQAEHGVPISRASASSSRGCSSRSTPTQIST